MPKLIFILLFFANGRQQRSKKLQRPSRSLSVGSIMIENNTNEIVKVHVESIIIPTNMAVIEVYYNIYVQKTMSLARFSVYLSDLTTIIDSETVNTGGRYKLQRYGDMYFLESARSKNENSRSRSNVEMVPGCTPWKPEWKNFEKHNINRPIMRTFSTGKQTLLMGQQRNFIEATKICSNLCGKVFLPASNQENQEAVDLLNEVADVYK